MDTMQATYKKIEKKKKVQSIGFYGNNKLFLDILTSSQNR
jgi:hypothetical protein